MCIMEVRAGEHTTTQIQAEYHNAQTVVTDLTMLIEVMAARREHERQQGEDAKVEAYNVAIARTKRAQDYIAFGAKELLASYGTMLSVADNPDDHPRNDAGGRTRDTTDEVKSVLGAGNIGAWECDSGKAARYETRR